MAIIAHRRGQTGGIRDRADRNARTSFDDGWIVEPDRRFARDARLVDGANFNRRERPVVERHFIELSLEGGISRPQRADQKISLCRQLKRSDILLIPQNSVHIQTGHAAGLVVGRHAVVPRAFVDQTARSHARATTGLRPINIQLGAIVVHPHARTAHPRENRSIGVPIRHVHPKFQRRSRTCRQRTDGEICLRGCSGHRGGSTAEEQPRCHITSATGYTRRHCDMPINDICIVKIKRPPGRRITRQQGRQCRTNPHFHDIAGYCPAIRDFQFKEIAAGGRQSNCASRRGWIGDCCRSRSL